MPTPKPRAGAEPLDKGGLLAHLKRCHAGGHLRFARDDPAPDPGAEHHDCGGNCGKPCCTDKPRPKPLRFARGNGSVLLRLDTDARLRLERFAARRAAEGQQAFDFIPFSGGKGKGQGHPCGIGPGGFQAGNTCHTLRKGLSDSHRANLEAHAAKGKAADPSPAAEAKASPSRPPKDRSPAARRDRIEGKIATAREATSKAPGDERAKRTADRHRGRDVQAAHIANAPAGSGYFSKLKRQREATQATAAPPASKPAPTPAPEPAGWSAGPRRGGLNPRRVPVKAPRGAIGSATKGTLPAKSAARPAGPHPLDRVVAEKESNAAQAEAAFEAASAAHDGTPASALKVKEARRRATHLRSLANLTRETVQRQTGGSGAAQPASAFAAAKATFGAPRGGTGRPQQPTAFEAARSELAGRVKAGKPAPSKTPAPAPSPAPPSVTAKAARRNRIGSMLSAQVDAEESAASGIKPQATTATTAPAPEPARQPSPDRPARPGRSSTPKTPNDHFHQLQDLRQAIDDGDPRATATAIDQQVKALGKLSTQQLQGIARDFHGRAAGGSKAQMLDKIGQRLHADLQKSKGESAPAPAGFGEKSPAPEADRAQFKAKLLANRAARRARLEGPPPKARQRPQDTSTYGTAARAQPFIPSAAPYIEPDRPRSLLGPGRANPRTGLSAYRS